MPILDKNNKKLVEKYNKFVGNNKYSDLMQSLEWARLKENWKCEIVYLKDEKDEFLATSMVLLRKVPGINSYLAYCPRGPILKELDSDLLEKLIEEFKSLREKYNIFCIRFDPNWKKDEVERKNLKSLYLEIKFLLRKYFNLNLI